MRQVFQVLNGRDHSEAKKRRREKASHTGASSQKNSSKKFQKGKHKVGGSSFQEKFDGLEKERPKKRN